MFDSCSAYQDPRPHLLFLSHCVPNPPDKGEKIRAHYELKALAERFQVHLVCFARKESEIGEAESLRNLCGSIYVHRLHPFRALMQAGLHFVGGQCLNEAYYRKHQVKRRVAALANRFSFRAAFVYTAVMSQYVPHGLTYVLDMVDTDSEKWLQYSQSRRPALAYRLEGRRLRELERRSAAQSELTTVTTENEAELVRRFVRDSPVVALENGVDAWFFDGTPRPLPGPFANRQFIAFVGTMDYPPNVDAIVRFSRDVFPLARQRNPGLELLVVGRDPVAQIVRLSNKDGIFVTGYVPDVRPYLSHARAIVAPLCLARGMQNKVIEALVMGRRVLASKAVCDTFRPTMPLGLVLCDSTGEFVDNIEQECGQFPRCDQNIRDAARERFSWKQNLARLTGDLASISGRSEICVI